MLGVCGTSVVSPGWLVLGVMMGMCDAHEAMQNHVLGAFPMDDWSCFVRIDEQSLIMNHVCDYMVRHQPRATAVCLVAVHLSCSQNAAGMKGRRLTFGYVYMKLAEQNELRRMVGIANKPSSRQTRPGCCTFQRQACLMQHMELCACCPREHRIGTAQQPMPTPTPAGPIVSSPVCWRANAPRME